MYGFKHECNRIQTYCKSIVRTKIQIEKEGFRNGALFFVVNNSKPNGTAKSSLRWMYSKSSTLGEWSLRYIQGKHDQCNERSKVTSNVASGAMLLRMNVRQHFKSTQKII